MIKTVKTLTIIEYTIIIAPNPNNKVTAYKAKALEMGYGDEGLWRGGGYEQTHFWVDPKRDFVAVIMSQMFAVPEAGYNRDNRIRGAVYKQLLAPSSQTKN